MSLPLTAMGAPGPPAPTRDWVGAGQGWLLFLLNHRAEPVEVTARTGGVDLLTGDRTTIGAPLRLPAYGVVVLGENG